MWRKLTGDRRQKTDWSRESHTEGQGAGNPGINSTAPEDGGCGLREGHTDVLGGRLPERTLTPAVGLELSGVGNLLLSEDGQHMATVRRAKGHCPFPDS